MNNKFGKIKLLTSNKVIAGEYTKIKLVYTVGYFGIDDTGSIKLSYRFASDIGKPQFLKPNQDNYTSVICSNSEIELSYKFDMKMNVRPWDRTIYIKLERGFLKKGDKVYITLGDTSFFSKGIRMQTFCEKNFQFNFSVDPFATYKYISLPFHKPIRIIPSDPYKIKIITPVIYETNKKFKINLVIEDKWGNPTYFESNKSITLEITKKSFLIQKKITFQKNLSKKIITISLNNDGNYKISLKKLNNLELINALIIIEKKVKNYLYWGDIHGQSEETIGTNSIDDYFRFAKNLACLDICCHQGNDFQIDDIFWNKIQTITKKYHKDFTFVCFLGYEWSGNTSLGGDRNILYYYDKGPIYRSSLFLLKSGSSIFKTASNVNKLHKALANKNILSIPHVGGRYSDIKKYFNSKYERSIEIHSAWGTFEWILFDAFKKKYKVGILANSDDHKGRPGASYPGASMFGAYGGLTCFIANSLTKKNIFKALINRKHYATTGNRVFLDYFISNSNDGYKIFNEENNKFISLKNKTILMGDICSTSDKTAEINYKILSLDEIEKIQLFNFEKLVFEKNYLKKGMVLRIIWQGAEYRGRGREVMWNGEISADKNIFFDLKTINSYNHEKKIELINSKKIVWNSITTGGHSGFEISIKNLNENILLAINNIKYKLNLKKIYKKNFIKTFGGIEKKITLSLISNESSKTSDIINHKLNLKKNNGFFFKTTFRYGHVVWTSPIYIEKNIINK